MNIFYKKISIIAFLIITAQNLASLPSFSYAQSQELQKEKIVIKNHSKAPSFLNFLYENSIGKIIRWGLTKKWFSSVAGFYCNRAISKYHIKSFIKNHNIDITQAQKSLKDFTCFNDFFIRTLKPEARPLSKDPSTLISPADGHIIIIENITNSLHFPVKESGFNLAHFLANQELATQFEGGTLMIFRLAPWDYHRFHFPLDCTPAQPQTISGIYESVNPLVYYTGIQPLTENERHLYLLQSTSCGTVAMVSVGALCVGKIIDTYQPYKKYQKGDEVGYFCFGGSTLVLVFPKGSIKVSEEIIKNSQEGKETSILMGAPIALHI